MAVRRNPGLIPENFVAVSPHIAMLQVSLEGEKRKVITCYAPPQVSQWQDFFLTLRTLLVPGNTIVMGDLNTVRTEMDRTSGKIDPTTASLNSLCIDFNLRESPGSAFFTYQHPTMNQQSRIDYILGLTEFMQ